MNTATLRRKILYVLAMVGLLVPLFILGQPPAQPVQDRTNRSADQGGTLAQLRERYDIGQASLGKIDPASETMRLASLGLRGVAATILWQKADYYKEEKYYERLAATLNQLSLLQPHFVSVWESQAHNLAYNVSAEFDDYRERYVWVKKGMDYLVRGTQFNRRQPLLQWHLGKYTTLKLGRSDEKRQFRQLFRDDESYHQTLKEYGLDLDQPSVRGSDRKPDNWLVGRLWFLQAIDLVKAGAYCKKNPLYLHGEPPLAHLYYAEAIEEEGVLDDRALFAWSRASDSWAEFGNVDIMTTWGHTVQLRELDTARKSAEQAYAKYREFTRELEPTIIEERKNLLTADEYASLTKAEADRSPAEQALASVAFNKAMLPPAVMAQRMPREKRAEATILVNDWQNKVEYADHVDRYREMINYKYWEVRSELEQTPTAVAARRQIYEAENFLTAADLNKAIQHYDAAWKNWDKVLKRYPMMIHEETADDLLKSIHRYAQATESSLEENFPLAWFVNYRTLRDRNKAGDDPTQMFRSFVDAAPTYEGTLDVPFEVGEEAGTTSEAASSSAAVSPAVPSRPPELEAPRPSSQE